MGIARVVLARVDVDAGPRGAREAITTSQGVVARGVLREAGVGAAVAVDGDAIVAMRSVGVETRHTRDALHDDLAAPGRLAYRDGASRLE